MCGVRESRFASFTSTCVNRLNRHFDQFKTKITTTYRYLQTSGWSNPKNTAPKTQELRCTGHHLSASFVIVRALRRDGYVACISPISYRWQNQGSPKPQLVLSLHAQLFKVISSSLNDEVKNRSYSSRVSSAGTRAPALKLINTFPSICSARERRNLTASPVFWFRPHCRIFRFVQ